MEGTVVQRHLDINYGIAGQVAVLHGCDYSFLNTWNILSRARAADYFALELVASALFERLQPQKYIAELAVTSALFLVFTLGLFVVADRLRVWDPVDFSLDIDTFLATRCRIQD